MLHFLGDPYPFYTAHARLIKLRVRVGLAQQHACATNTLYNGDGKIPHQLTSSAVTALTVKSGCSEQLFCAFYFVPL